MAEILHISPSAYNRIENDESNSWVNYIENFCKIFYIKPEELFASNISAQNNKDNTFTVRNHTQYTNDPTNQLLNKIVELYEDKIKSLKKEIEALQSELVRSQRKI
jgi:transcriptional regulator with XRE-family HTH domain